MVAESLPQTRLLVSKQAVSAFQQNAQASNFQTPGKKGTLFDQIQNHIDEIQKQTTKEDLTPLGPAPEAVLDTSAPKVALTNPSYLQNMTDNYLTG